MIFLSDLLSRLLHGFKSLELVWLEKENGQSKEIIDIGLQRMNALSVPGSNFLRSRAPHGMKG